jgi:hypothetical protein
MRGNGFSRSCGRHLALCILLLYTKSRSRLPACFDKPLRGRIKLMPDDHFRTEETNTALETVFCNALANDRGSPFLKTPTRKFSSQGCTQDALLCTSVHRVRFSGRTLLYYPVLTSRPEYSFLSAVLGSCLTWSQCSSRLIAKC